MRVRRLPSLSLPPPREVGRVAILPLPLDLGGPPGTGAGAAWLGEILSNECISQAIGAGYHPLPSILCETAFGRVEPSLYAAAATFQVWRAGYRPFWLFGDHGLSLGPVRAAGAFDKPVTVFVFDSHHDRLDGILKNRGSCSALESEVHQANVITWIGRMPNVRAIFHVGSHEQMLLPLLDSVPNLEPLHVGYIKDDIGESLSWIEKRLADAISAASLILLSVDFSVIDPKELPAVDYRVPNGLTVSQLVQLAAPIARASCSVDFAELNLIRDFSSRGRRAALSVVSALLTIASPPSEVHAWRTVIYESPRRPLAALNPYVSAIIKNQVWLEPSPTESAVLRGDAVEDLASTFTAQSLRNAIDSIKEALSSDTFIEPVYLTCPTRVIMPGGHLSGGCDHNECVAISTDCQLLAAAGWDHAVYIWKMSSENPSPTKRVGHTAWIVAAAFSPNGKFLATGSDDNTVCVWPTTLDHEEPIICRGHLHWVKAIAWKSDGTLIASASFDGEIRIWNSDNGHCIRRIEAQPDAIWSLAWAKDGGKLISCGEKGVVRAWCTETGHLLHNYQGHLGSVERCRLMDDKSVWTLNRAGWLMRHLEDSTHPIQIFNCGFEQTLDLCVSPDSRYILVAGPKNIRCLNIDTGQVEFDFPVHFSIAAIAMSAGGEIAVAGDSASISLFKWPKV